MSKKFFVSLMFFGVVAFTNLCASESLEKDTEVSEVSEAKKQRRLQTCNSVLRISVSAFKVDLFEPYRAPYEESWNGSGFFINEDGDFLTNYHVVEQAHDIKIQVPSIGNDKFSAKVVGV